MTGQAVDRAAANADVAQPVPAPVGHVFVVGQPRTGTHLMCDIINASGEAGIGGETRFISGAPRLGLARPGLLASLPSADAPLTEDEARRVVEAIARRVGRGDRQTAYWRRILAEVGEAELLDRFLATPRRARDLLDVGMSIRARGRRIRGDKTPANLYHVPRLLEWFPDARVIHMMRDPRDVFASTMKQGWIGPRRLRLPATGVLDLTVGFWWALDMAYRWRRAVRLDEAYRRRYPGQYLLCRFEELVADPDRNIRRACDFLGIPVTERMLAPRIKHSSYFRHRTPGFRTDALARWRRTLNPALAAWIALLCGPDLERYGYPRR